MPYIPHDQRSKLAFTLPSGLTAGELTFILCDLVDQYVGLVPNFDRLHSAIGILECTKQECYRRLVVPFEDKKEETNGDVFIDRTNS